MSLPCIPGRWPYCPFWPFIVRFSHIIISGHTCWVVRIVRCRVPRGRLRFATQFFLRRWFLVLLQDGRFCVLPMVCLHAGGAVGVQPHLYLDAGFADPLHDFKRPFVCVLKGAELVALKPNMRYFGEVFRVIDWRVSMAGVLYGRPPCLGPERL